MSSRIARRESTGQAFGAGSPARAGKDGFVAESFLGSAIPEVKRIVPLLDGLEAKSFRRTLHLAFNYLKGEDVTEEQFAAAGPVLEDIQTLFTGLFLILRAALRARTPEDTVQADLTALKIPTQCIQDIAALLRSSRDLLQDTSEKNKLGFPKLKNLRWRVDVTISTTSSLRVMKPYILMQMTLSDGSIRSFECPVDKFNDLRFHVAKMLREMQDIERNPLYKVVEQERRRGAAART